MQAFFQLMTRNVLFISAAESVTSPFTVQPRNVSDFLAKAKLHLNFNCVNMSHKQFCKKKKPYLKCPHVLINAVNAWH